ncbi:flagellar assembly protein FliW [Paraliobacillus salinarum]|uniref:flagellar assembly protein FliW n=1 Tax=Paraliobacillus salinarum TaxID=1158996 RepID=UPI0015F6B741|nr:flagellar assembly protein FliW [Paraliobacillus salinarum]
MNIQTKYHGQIDIENDNILTFPQGIPGFVNEKKFVLLELPGNSVFQVLQSITTSALGFIVINPYQIYHDYAFDLDNHIIEALEIKSPEQVKVVSIVSLKEPFEQSTINLQAPIIINHVNNLAKQYITNEKKHLIKAPLQPSKQEREG